MNKIQDIRSALSARLLDINSLGKLIGGSRELSLAATTVQQSRMLLGTVLELRQEGIYPDAPYTPSLPDDELAALRVVIDSVKQILVDTGAYRRELWARDYGSLEEVLYAAAFAELVLCKSWLDTQLTILTPVDEPAAPPTSDEKVVPFPAADPAAGASAENAPPTTPADPQPEFPAPGPFPT